MASKGLHSLAGTDIPELGESITGTGNKDVLVGRVDANGHHVAKVVGKLSNLGSRLDIPQHTGHVARGGNDATIVDKATAGKVTGVARELARNTGGTLTRRQVVNRANVVQTTTSNVVATWRISASHDPG